MVFTPYTASLSMQNFTMNNHTLELEHYNVWPTRPNLSMICAMSISMGCDKHVSKMLRSV